MTRLKDDMNMLQAMGAISGGDPEAMRVCLDIGKRSQIINPYLPDPFIPILQLDELGVYDSRITLLYNGFCEGSMEQFLACMFAVEKGLIPGDDLVRRVVKFGETEEREINFEILIDDLRRQFPMFGPESNLNDATCDPVKKRKVQGGTDDSGRDGASRTTDGI